LLPSEETDIFDLSLGRCDRLNLEKNQARNLDLNRTRTLVHILKMSQRAVPLQILPPDQVQVQHQVLTVLQGLPTLDLVVVVHRTLTNHLQRRIVNLLPLKVVPASLGSLLLILSSVGRTIQMFMEFDDQVAREKNLTD